MHSLTDMLDHIRVIIKTLQIFETEVHTLKKDTDKICEDAGEPELSYNIRLIEDKLSQLTTRSGKALKIVEVRNIEKQQIE